MKILKLYQNSINNRFFVGSLNLRTNQNILSFSNTLKKTPENTVEVKTLGIFCWFISNRQANLVAANYWLQPNWSWWAYSCRRSEKSQTGRGWRPRASCKSQRLQLSARSVGEKIQYQIFQLLCATSEIVARRATSGDCIFSNRIRDIKIQSSTDLCLAHYVDMVLIRLGYNFDFRVLGDCIIAKKMIFCTDFFYWIFW